MNSGDVPPYADSEIVMRPTQAVCPRCDGQGSYPVRENEDAVEVEGCPDCNKSGMRPVGVFDPICAHHCTMCEGQDHHWSYDGDEDTEGEPLMGCRHCPALRPLADEDADAG